MNLKESREGKENCNYNIKSKIKILSKKETGKNFTVEERGTRDS